MLLYIHIPFCDSKCHYCSFNSFTRNHHLKHSYMQALLRQLHSQIALFKPSTLRSIFIGGGTPSTIAPSLYEPLFEVLEPYIGKNTEITTEANPSSATKEWLEGMKKLGIDRISLGVQSFDDEKLRFLGRSHDRKRAIGAIENAYETGFEHISIDLIYDTAKDTKELLRKDILTALSLPIDHLSAYELIIEDDTPFATKSEVKRGDEYLGYFIQESISKKFTWYEVSNYGSYRCMHNIGYWELRNYMGVGCGAVGFLHDTRLYPSRDLFAYIENPLSLKKELLSPEDIRMEKLFLGLRSCVGIDKELVSDEKASLLVDEGKLREKDGKLYNPNYFLADELALFLL